MLKFSLDAKQYNRNQKRVVRQYRRIMYAEIGDWFDRSRESSVSYIRKRKSSLDGVRSIRKLYKEQPSIDGKLTERTSALIKMLRDRGTWSKDGAISRFKNGAFKGIIRVNKNKGTAYEKFTGNLKTDIDSAKRYSWNKKDTPQKLAVRFQHDSPNGIRGSKRPFLSIAARKEFIRTRQITAARINALGEL